jgi:hypothetical protein
MVEVNQHVVDVLVMSFNAHVEMQQIVVINAIDMGFDDLPSMREWSTQTRQQRQAEYHKV